MTRFANRPVVVVAILAGAAFLVWIPLWRRGAEEMRGSINSWAEEQRAAGLTVVYEDLRVRGFPLRFRGFVAGASIAGDGWRWAAPLLRIDAAPLAPRRLNFSVAGRHRFHVRRLGSVAIESDGGSLSIAREGRRGWKATLRAKGGRIAGERWAATVRRLRAAVAPDTDDAGTLEASLQAADIVLRAQKREARASSLMVDAAIAEFPSPAAAPERGEIGGAVEIRKFAADLDGARISLAGRIRLDERGYPQGALKAEIADPGGVAQFLGDIGALPAAEAERAAASLALLAIAGGGKIKGPIELKDGKASFAGIALAPLPAIGAQP
jgi:hypothetical protein